MKVSMYLQTNGTYRLLDESEVMTVNLPEGHQDKEEAVIQAVTETTEGVEVLIITGESPDEP